MTDATASTHMDDAVDSGEAEAALLESIMGRTDFLQEEDRPVVPEPAEEAPAEDYEEDLEVESDAAEPDDVEPDDVPEEEVEVEEEDGAEEESEAPTEESETYVLDDLEDIMVTHKIDGEEVTRPLSEWIAGSATQQHLSKQGRELGEARKAFEEERAQAFEQLNTVGEVFVNSIMEAENGHQAEYNRIKGEIQKAKADGDTYSVGELTGKLEDAQKAYWDARNKRESNLKKVQELQEQKAQEEFAAQVETFYKEVPTLIPDWNEEVATSVRDFALEEGLPESLINQITDPAIVKFVDDYRRLKNGVSAGKKKRQAVAKKIPAKRAKSPEQKSQDKAKMQKARAFRQDASKEDQMDFLKNYASKSLSNLR